MAASSKKTHGCDPASSMALVQFNPDNDIDQVTCCMCPQNFKTTTAFHKHMVKAHRQKEQTLKIRVSCSVLAPHDNRDQENTGQSTYGNQFSSLHEFVISSKKTFPIKAELEGASDASDVEPFQDGEAESSSPTVTSMYPNGATPQHSKQAKDEPTIEDCNLEKAEIISENEEESVTDEVMSPEKPGQSVAQEVRRKPRNRRRKASLYPGEYEEETGQERFMQPAKRRRSADPDWMPQFDKTVMSVEDNTAESVTPKRGRGRPRKTPRTNEANATTSAKKQNMTSTGGRAVNNVSLESGDQEHNRKSVLIVQKSPQNEGTELDSSAAMPTSSEACTIPVPTPIKRGRGRPRKTPVVYVEINQEEPTDEMEEGQVVYSIPLRGRGRPRKAKTNHTFIKQTVRKSCPAGTEFQCAECSWKTTHHFNYHRHMLVRHTGQMDTVCSYCDKKIGIQTGQTGYGCKKIKCQDCPQLPAMNRLAHKLHRHQEHGGPEPSAFICDKCGYKCYKAHNFRRHKCYKRRPKEEPAEALIRCSFEEADHKPSCNFVTSFHWDYHLHLVTHHLLDGVGTIQCDRCHKDFGKDSIKTVKGRRKLCPYGCEGPNMSSYEYKRHMYESHGGQKPEGQTCEICGFMSDVPFHFKAHVATHSKVDRRTGVNRPKGRPSDAIHICEKCGYQASKKYFLDRHMVREHIKKEFDLKCDQCDFVTFDEYSLKRHQLQAHEKKVRGCPDCGEKQVDLAGLKQHLVLKHSYQGDFQYMCDDCGKVLNNQASFLEHRDSHSVRNIYICDQCDFAAVHLETLREHQSSHPLEPGGPLQPEGPLEPQNNSQEGSHGGQIQSSGVASHSQDGLQTDTQENQQDGRATGERLCCDQCDFFTMIPLALRRHKRIHILVSTGGYTHCGLSFDNIADHNKHLFKVHNLTGVIKHQCQWCGLILETNRDLKLHRKREHTPRELYLCNQCDVTCDRRWNLTRHKMVRHKKQMISCEMCDYKNKSVQVMVYHYQHHHITEVPAYLQDVKIPNQTKSRRRVFRVSRQGTAVRTTCSVCGKSLNSMAMKKHMEMHQGIRTFKCQYSECSFSTRSSYSLRNHIRRRHMGIRVPARKTVYICSLCHYRTQEKSRFLTHMESSHAIHKEQAMQFVLSKIEPNDNEEKQKQELMTDGGVYDTTEGMSHGIAAVEHVEGVEETTAQHIESQVHTVYHLINPGTATTTNSSVADMTFLPGTVVMVPSSEENGQQDQIILSVPEGEADNTIYEIVEYQNTN